MDDKETAYKQKGEGKGPGVEHSLKLWLFVSIVSVHVIQYLIKFIVLLTQLAGIYICTDPVSEHYGQMLYLRAVCRADSI
jgi:hypothetical protein